MRLRPTFGRSAEQDRVHAVDVFNWAHFAVRLAAFGTALAALIALALATQKHARGWTGWQQQVQGRHTHGFALAVV